MNFSKNSPFFVVEEMLGKFLDEEICGSKLFDVLEKQHYRVSDWLEKLSSLNQKEDRTLQELTHLGIEGSEKMLDGLEDLLEAVEEDCPDAMDEACGIIWQGHEVIASSFQTCDEIREEETLELVGDIRYV